MAVRMSGSSSQTRTIDPTASLYTESATAGEAKHERRPIAARLVLDSPTMCFRDEPAEVEAHAALPTLTLDVLAKQVRADVLRDLRTGVRDPDLDAAFVVP